MADERKPRKRTNKRTYVARPNAIHVTLYSQDGSPVPKSVLNEAAESITDIAFKNNLLIGLAET